MPEVANPKTRPHPKDIRGIRERRGDISKRMQELRDAAIKRGGPDDKEEREFGELETEAEALRRLSDLNERFLEHAEAERGANTANAGDEEIEEPGSRSAYFGLHDEARGWSPPARESRLHAYMEMLESYAPRAIRSLLSRKRPRPSSGRRGAWKNFERAQTPEYRKAFEDYLFDGEKSHAEHELRTMTEGVNADGGYLPPTEFFPELAKILIQQVTMRSLSRVIGLGSWKNELAWETGLATASYQAEGASFSDTTPQFNKSTLTPYRLGALVKVSFELAQDAPARGPDFSIESIVGDQIARAFALAEEAAFIAGAAANKPKGIMTYTNSQISTGKTLASQTVPTAAEIVDWVYSLPRQYRQDPSCAILMHDTTLGVIRKLGKFGTGTSAFDFFWEPSGQLGEPDRIMGIPVYASQYVDTPAAGKLIGLIGAFRYSIIGERSAMTLQVLRERFADAGLIGYIAWCRNDLAITSYDAFRYLSTAA